VELMAQNPIPKVIGRYEIVREIGRGAMGVVYEARDASLMRRVALKTMSLASLADDVRAQFEKRFYQEARAAAGLQHPAIVVVYEVGTDDTTKAPYMALEYLRGLTLEKVLAEAGRLDWRKALGIVERLADALGHAHGQGIVHRDMKPANVMILASGEPKIMDFGVAKLQTSQLTTQGQVFGSPAYMAPEQALEARADARSDLFSLGAVLFELLTGERAFGRGSVSEILMRLADEQPPPPSSLVPGLPAGVDAIVAHALAKDPAQRYGSAKPLAEDIENALAGRPLRHTPPPRAGAPPASAGVAPSPPPIGATTPASSGSAAPRAPESALRTQLAGKGGSALALPPGKRVSLAFLSGPRAGDAHVFQHATVLIGRDGGNVGAGIELADTQVSRSHAVVEAHGTRFVVRDLESTNGTFVDGQRVREHQIEERGEFQVGATRFMLIVADED